MKQWLLYTRVSSIPSRFSWRTNSTIHASLTTLESVVLECQNFLEGDLEQQHHQYMHDWHKHSGEIPYDTYLRDQLFFNGMNIKEKLVHIALIGLFAP